MKKKYTHYSAEFRKEAVKLAGELGFSHAASRLNMPVNTLRNWIERGMPTHDYTKNATIAAPARTDVPHIVVPTALKEKNKDKAKIVRSRKNARKTEYEDLKAKRTERAKIAKKAKSTTGILNGATFIKAAEHELNEIEAKIRDVEDQANALAIRKKVLESVLQTYGA